MDRCIRAKYPFGVKAAYNPAGDTVLGSLRQRANPLQTEPAHQLGGIANVRVATELNIGRIARLRARPDKTPRPKS
jgi:hypothetical protein